MALYPGGRRFSLSVRPVTQFDIEDAFGDLHIRRADGGGEPLDADVEVLLDCRLNPVKDRQIPSGTVRIHRGREFDLRQRWRRLWQFCR